MYYVNSKFLVHDSGSKFYEAIQITENKTGRSILIKRWGAIGLYVGGGQTKIERGTQGEMAKAFMLIINEKKAYRSGKGKYIEEDRMFGIHKAVAVRNKIIAETFDRNLTHWSDRGTRDAIANYFGSDVEDIVAVTDQDFEVVIEEPEPEPDRGENWASW